MPDPRYPQFPDAPAPNRGVPAHNPGPYRPAPSGPAYNPQPERTGDVPYDPPKPSAPNGDPPSSK